MHSTGYYIEDKRPFAEKTWGHRTAIYVKLAKGLSHSQWTGIFGGLEYTQGLQEKLNEFSKPVENWTDNPEDYFIVLSDPPDTEAEE